MDKRLANDSKIAKGINLYLTMDGNNFDRLYKSKGENYNQNGIEASGSPSSDLSATTSVNVPNRYLKYLAHRYQDPKKHNKTLEETLSWDIGDVNANILLIILEENRLTQFL